MGAKNSKPVEQPANHQQKDMVQVGDGVQVGTFLLEKSMLQAERQRLADRENSMDSHTQSIAQNIYNEAANKITGVQGQAGRVIQDKDQYISTLEDQIKLEKEKFDCFVAENIEKQKEINQNYENKISSLEEILKTRGEEITATYEKYYSATEAVFPTKKYSPVCQETLLKIKDCYNNSKGQTLHCSGLVDELKQCITQVKKDKGIM